MPLPDPAPGLVICYSYLWSDEGAEGSEEGRKNRPCAIVLTRLDADGDTAVIVAPVTHARPRGPRAVELPAAVKRRLGLDDEAAWIVTTEINVFIWPGYDLRPVAPDRPDTFAWGFLPADLLNTVKRNIQANRAAGLLRPVQR